METIAINRSGYLYERIVSTIEQQILSGAWKLGVKLPSIRTIAHQYEVSISTVLTAYYELESKSLIKAKPQSGYYVSYIPNRLTRLPEISRPSVSAKDRPIDDVINKVYGNVANKNIAMLSLGVPSNELLPIAKLNKCLTEAMRRMPSSGTSYETVQGCTKLREQIARRAFNWQGNLTAEMLTTTNGCINAVAYALMATTNKGDTIAVESPIYFGILQLAQTLGLEVLELPTNPVTGIEIDALKKAVIEKKIKACLLVSNFSNPMGGIMPDEHKKEVVRLLEHYQIPLIEDDLYGDIYFGDTRPSNCKTYDESGNVLWCSSVSKTLAPGYRVGWLAPGKYSDKIQKLKLSNAMASAGITEEAIAIFLETGRYENHLAKLRKKLQNNSLQFIKVISEYFPDNTKISKPQGGLVLWLELDKRVNTLELYESAMRQHISIAPGNLFTLQNQFDNCVRLSYGLQWSDKLENSLKILGRLTKNMI
jgi:DNA-binding transcriptional MocR family regulator